MKNLDARGVLVKVRELLVDPTRWTKHAYAENEKGELSDIGRADACKFCLLGGVYKVLGVLPGQGVSVAKQQSVKEVHGLLVTAISRSKQGRVYTELDAVTFFNDRTDVEHKDVLAVLDAAIEAAA